MEYFNSITDGLGTVLVVTISLVLFILALPRTRKNILKFLFPIQYACVDQRYDFISINSDAFFSGINSEEKLVYQKLFRKIYDSACLEKYHATVNKDFSDNNIHLQIYKLIDELCELYISKGVNLSSEKLKVFVELYIYANQDLRIKHVDSWIEKVIYRKDEDFFPDIDTILNIIVDRMTG